MTFILTLVQIGLDWASLGLIFMVYVIGDQVEYGCLTFLVNFQLLE